MRSPAGYRWHLNPVHMFKASPSFGNIIGTKTIKNWSLQFYQNVQDVLCTKPLPVVSTYSKPNAYVKAKEKTKSMHLILWKLEQITFVLAMLYLFMYTVSCIFLSNFSIVCFLRPFGLYSPFYLL